MATHVMISAPHRWLTCARRGRKHLRLVKGGMEILCKSCGETEFYSREQINEMWDELEQEEARKKH